jgi:hypothetical protein
MWRAASFAGCGNTWSMLRSAAGRLIRLMAPLVMATFAVVWWFDTPLHPLLNLPIYSGGGSIRPVLSPSSMLPAAGPSASAHRWVHYTGPLLLVVALVGFVVAILGAALGVWDRRRENAFHTTASPLI